MKQLELTIYKTWINGLDGTCYCSAFRDSRRPYPVNVDDLIEAKRLTDAELAAEYHAANGAVTFLLATGRDPIQNGKRLDALARFATLPSYDEPTP